MKTPEMFPVEIFSIGPIVIKNTVIVTWFVMAFIIVASYFITRRLSIKPGVFQEIFEAIIESAEKTIKDTLPISPWTVIPFITTLWIFIGASNLIGLIPGFMTPTSDINTTFAFAIIS